MAKLMISKKQIISIEEFMENYIGKVYDGEEKLTHKTMKMYLEEKKIRAVERIKFHKAKKENLLSGEYIAVKDNCGQVLLYRNPRYRDVASLLEELNASANVSRLRSTRKKILDELGYKETCSGDVVKKEFLVEEIEEITEKVNRQKMIVRRRTRSILRSNYR